MALHGGSHMTDTEQPQIASSIAIEGRFKALVDQRDAAMNRIVMLAGELADMEEKIASQARLIAKMQAEAAKSNIPTGGTP